ncbi:MAG: hypothetical protein ACM3SR_05105 [Ignavibacteriales bacterium]
MQIERGFKIAGKEWTNIRVSLEGYGDIGEFDSKNHVKNRLTLIDTGNKFPTYEYLTEGSLLIRNLIEMKNKLLTYGYFTQEAAYVFAFLASKAAEKLGLVGEMAQTFGRGYSWVRTGRFDPYGIEEQHVIKQLFFMKIFFPLGGYFNWDFNSPVVKTKLRAILHKFVAWQDNPRGYIQDIKDYKAQIEPLWHGLSSALDFSRDFPELIPFKEEVRRSGNTFI